MLDRTHTGSLARRASDVIRGERATCVLSASDLSVDVVAEWVAACDGRSVRFARLPDDASERKACMRSVAACASAVGLTVIRVTSREGLVLPPGTAVPRGRSVLVLAEEGRGHPLKEAHPWIELGSLPVRIVAVATWRGPHVGGTPPAMPAASSESRSARDRRVSVERARSIEVTAWRLRRARACGRASAAFMRATDAWRSVGEACAAVRTLAAAAAQLAQHGRFVQAVTAALCADMAGRAIGRHQWSTRRSVSLARRCWSTALAQAWPRPRADESDASGGCLAVTGNREHGSNPGGPAVMEDLVQVLQACHDVEDAPAMSHMCSVVRERLGAAAVGVVVAGQPGPLAGSGHVPYATPETASRVLDTAEIVDPSPRESGVEAAVPVRLGGTPIGALCCRWPIGSAPDTPLARALLIAAATACAPGLRTLLDNRRAPDTNSATFGIIGESRAVSELRDAIRRAAVVPFAVLIEGESGSGKELVARAIHEASARRRRRFCAVNCAAISDELFEAELFGHAKGAFTGALGERPGLFEDADGGTLLLDEVGELTPRGQAKLLRVLQEGEVRRVGENASRRVDVRVVAATNRSLAVEARARRFRDDLRFRLDVVRIALPALRERREDIPLLVDHYWRIALQRTGGRARLDEATVDLMSRYHWPGNVREVQNLTATLAVRAPQRGRVRPSDLPFHVTAASPAATTLQRARRQFDAGFIRATLSRCGGQRTEAAKELGMTRQGLAKLIVRLELEGQEAVASGAAE